MSLALAIYNTASEFGKPELLLIDEPDAGLHPSMSQMMVKVLNENIVMENKIPTIISTHSPTTVIATEGISIYQLERGIGTPKKTSIQSAKYKMIKEGSYLLKAPMMFNIMKE